MTQQELADRMRERGFKWSQATVWDVERGKRPMRLTESLEVVAILNRPDVTVEMLWLIDEDLKLALDFRDSFESIHKAWDGVVWSISRLRSAQDAWMQLEKKAERLNITPRKVTLRKLTRRTQDNDELPEESKAVVTGSNTPVGAWLSRGEEVRGMNVERAIEKELRQHEQEQEYSESVIEDAADFDAEMRADEARGK